MKRMLSMVMMVMFAGTLVSCAGTEQQAAPKPEQGAPKQEQSSKLDIKRSEVKSTVAKVEAIDLKTRMVKLKSLEGKLFTVRVGPEAVNLPQVRKGDTVEVKYAEAIEVRMAEPGEIRNETAAVVGRAKPGSKPAGIVITETNITATILELDKVKETATLKMADGVVATVKVQNPANLDKVKVGDTIAIKYIEAVDIKVMGKKK